MAHTRRPQEKRQRLTWNEVLVHFCEIGYGEGHAGQLLPDGFSDAQAEGTATAYGYAHQDA